MAPRKRRVHSVNGRHYDDRWRNVSGVFRKPSDPFLISDLYRSLPTSHGDCRSALNPVVLKPQWCLETGRSEAVLDVQGMVLPTQYMYGGPSTE